MGSMEDQEHHVVLAPQEQINNKGVEQLEREELMVRMGSSLEDQEYQVVLAPQEPLLGEEQKVYRSREEQEVRAEEVQGQGSNRKVSKKVKNVEGSGVLRSQNQSLVLTPKETLVEVEEEQKRDKGTGEGSKEV